jgi:hypothetical protein
MILAHPVAGPGAPRVPHWGGAAPVCRPLAAWLAAPVKGEGGEAR